MCLRQECLVASTTRDARLTSMKLSSSGGHPEFSLAGLLSSGCACTDVDSHAPPASGRIKGTRQRPLTPGARTKACSCERGRPTRTCADWRREMRLPVLRRLARRSGDARCSALTDGDTPALIGCDPERAVPVGTATRKRRLPCRPRMDVPAGRLRWTDSMQHMGMQHTHAPAAGLRSGVRQTKNRYGRCTSAHSAHRQPSVRPLVRSPSEPSGGRRPVSKAPVSWSPMQGKCQQRRGRRIHDMGGIMSSGRQRAEENSIIAQPFWNEAGHSVACVWLVAWRWACGKPSQSGCGR